jgi:hypothetical protein
MNAIRGSSPQVVAEISEVDFYDAVLSGLVSTLAPKISTSLESMRVYGTLCRPLYEYLESRPNCRVGFYVSELSIDLPVQRLQYRIAELSQIGFFHHYNWREQLDPSYLEITSEIDQPTSSYFFRLPIQRTDWMSQECWKSLRT